MLRLIQVETAPDQYVFFEVDVDETVGGVAPATRRGELATRARATLQDSLEQVRPAAEAVLRMIESVSMRPDDVEVTFGVKLTAEAGAIIARTGGEASFQIRMHWHTAPAPGPALGDAPAQD